MGFDKLDLVEHEFTDRTTVSMYMDLIDLESLFIISGWVLREDALATEKEIEQPKDIETYVNANDVLLGAPIPALDRVTIMDADTWENLTLELVSVWKSQYDRV